MDDKLLPKLTLYSHVSLILCSNLKVIIVLSDLQQIVKLSKQFASDKTVDGQGGERSLELISWNLRDVRQNFLQLWFVKKGTGLVERPKIPRLQNPGLPEGFAFELRQTNSQEISIHVNIQVVFSTGTWFTDTSHQPGDPQ